MKSISSNPIYSFPLPHPGKQCAVDCPVSTLVPNSARVDLSSLVPGKQFSQRTLAHWLLLFVHPSFFLFVVDWGFSVLYGTLILINHDFSIVAYCLAISEYLTKHRQNYSEAGTTVDDCAFSKIAADRFEIRQQFQNVSVSATVLWHSWYGRMQNMQSSILLI